MRISTLLLGAFALLATSGCHRTADEEVRPISYDELGLETGHWEWKIATRGWQGNFTPATTGYTRQLVFGAGGQLTVYRGSQPAYHATYQLSMGQSKYCNLPGVLVPLITYVSEPGLPNDDVKIYHITQSSNGEQFLEISGESACVDAGAYETYQWVKE